MSDFLDHLDQLKNFVAPSILDGVNKIYFLEVQEKPGLVKIGDTHREVAERNAESIINASLQLVQDALWQIAKKFDGSVFRDKTFHKFLEEQGYERQLNHKGSKSEWFYITLEQALNEFAEFTKRPVYTQVTLRPAQHYLLDQLQISVDAGYEYINAGFCVRVGKTIISLSLAANNNWMPVYIGKNLTSQSSAKTDNEKYGIVPEMATVSIHGNDYELGDGDSAIVNRVIQKIDAENKSNKAIIFYVDEVDDSSHTNRSRAVITRVVEHYKNLGKFARIVTMSGTRIYRGEKILKDLTSNEIKSLSLEYYEMQMLQPNTTCKRNFRYINFYTKKGNLVSISDSMKNKDQGHKSIATCVSTLLGTNKFEFTVNPDFPHWFMKFATVGKDNANKLCTYLNRNYNLIENREFYFAAINGDFTKAEEAQEYCEKIINTNPNKTCVFISQGMATTSFSINTIGNSVVFTDNEITSDDIQALHRSATWANGKDDCNMIIVTTNDSTEIAFDDIFEDETKIAKTREEKIQILRVLLDNNSMIHFHEATGFTPVKVTHEVAERVIDKKQQAMTQIASIVHALSDLDETLQDAIFQTIEGKKSTSRKSTSAKGSKFDPFGADDSNNTTTQRSSDALTLSKKQQILLTFVENAIMVPAVAREQETTIEEFEFWDELSVNKELFIEVYNSSWQFRDRIDTIYNLCEDENYLLKNYIDKIAV
jgi:hypothetical protein